LNLEKKRNFQNQYRLLSTRKVNREHHPTMADLITRSSYGDRNIIDESKTTTIPSNLRTAAPYFKKKQHQVNTMIHAYGLPQIFYTMTMAEDKWPHLHQILRTSDNNDTLPTNRPLHVYMFYRNYLNNIRNKLWKNPNLAGWGKWKHFFERDEFHGFVYTERKTPELIALDIIRANVPDPDIEPELYRLVTTFQVHHCDHRCRPQGQTDEPCSKGFPQPLSQTTHCSGNSLRYLYRRTKEED